MPPKKTQKDTGRRETSEKHNKVEKTNIVMTPDDIVLKICSRCKLHQTYNTGFYTNKIQNTCAYT